MQHLEWSDALALELPAMDDTHREFVDLLAAVNTATDDSLLAQWAALIDHTDDHFGREDAWMQATRFASSNCHTMQHKVVLQVLREGLKRGQAGELGVVRQMAQELVIWFPHHAQASPRIARIVDRRVLDKNIGGTEVERRGEYRQRRRRSFLIRGDRP